MGGGVEIHHKSVSGDFLLSKNDHVVDLQEMTVLGKPQTELFSNEEILAGIERGEISVQEAVGLIERGHHSPVG